jgi:hypothetical protein
VLQLPQHLQSAVQEVHQCKLEVRTAPRAACPTRREKWAPRRNI